MALVFPGSPEHDKEYEAPNLVFPTKTPYKDGMGRSRMIDIDVGSSSDYDEPVMPEDGSFTVNEPKWRRSGSIRGLNQPLEQAQVGAIKAFDIADNFLSGSSTPIEIIKDPGRLLDAATPYMNFGLAASEWAVQKAADLGAGVAEGATGEPIEPIEVKFPRVSEKFGSYPEQNTPFGRVLAKQSTYRKDTVQKFEKEFKEKTGSAPYITNAMGFIPDLLTIYGGAATNIPKVAAVIEGGLSGAHAMTEGEDVGQAKVAGTIGGYAATKVLNTFMNKLSPAESAMIEQVSMDPNMKQDTVDLLKFYADHPNFEINTVRKGGTGNPYVDQVMERQKFAMGNEVYTKYMNTIKGLGDSAKSSVKDITAEFAGQSAERYNKMKATASKAWDDLGANVDNSKTIPTEILRSDIDEALVNAPDVVKSFALKVMDSRNNKQAIADVIRQKKELFADYTATKEVASEGDLKVLKRNYAEKIRKLDEEKVLLEGMDAKAALNLSPLDIIEKIKKLNNKEFVAGGNINTKDKTQSMGLNKLRTVLQDSLKGFDDVKKIEGLYDKAKAASKDVYSTFGYSGGKNQGKKVFNPELQQVLGEEFPEQLKIVEGMMNESPAVFSAKMQNLEGMLTPKLVQDIRKNYLQSKLGTGLVKGTKTGDMPRMNPEAFESSMQGLLDSNEGRQMLIDNYGEGVLKELALIRGINRDLGEAASQGKLPEEVSSLWPTDLWSAVKGLVSGNLKDYLYTRRMLKGYGEQVGMNIDEEMTRNVLLRGAAGATGGLVADEGYEAEGIAAGTAVGNAASVADFIRKSIKRIR